MPVRRPEYDTSESYWASADPRILSYTYLAHRNTEQDAPREKSSLEPEPGYRLLLPYSEYRSPEA
jgi:hypothetical protein